MQLSPWFDQINSKKIIIWPQNFNFFQLKPKLTSKSIFLAIKPFINSIKSLINLIELINLWFWTFLPQIEFSLSTGLSSVNNILSNFNLFIFEPPQPIFGHFPSAPTSSSHWYYFFVFFWIYIFIFCIFFFFVWGPKISNNKGDERGLVGALSVFLSFFLEGETMKEKEIRVSVVSFWKWCL